MARTSKGNLAQKFEARYLVIELPDRQRLSTYQVADKFVKDYGIQGLDHSTISRWVRTVDDQITSNPELLKERCLTIPPPKGM